MLMRLASPVHSGDAESANARSKSVSFACGSAIEFSLQIDELEGVIREARFRTNGCGHMVAGADVAADWIIGKKITDLHGLPDAELRQVIETELGPIPPERLQCDRIVFEALRGAMADYRRHRIEEFQGEKALICTCFGISEDTIVEVIAGNDVTDVDAVSELCRAGSGCGSCRMMIEELIDSTHLAVRDRDGEKGPDPDML